MAEKPCRWDDKMFDASTMGLPVGRSAEYGKEMRSYQRQCEEQREKQRKAAKRQSGGKANELSI